MRITLVMLLVAAILIAGCVEEGGKLPPPGPVIQPNDTGLYQPPSGTPYIKIISPKDDDTIQLSAVGIRVNVTNFRLADIANNRPNRQNEGHIHYLLDGMEKKTPLTIVSFIDVPVGDHVLRVELVNNDHSLLSPRIYDIVRFRTAR